MENARKIQREKEEREKEVFSIGKNWESGRPITIPQPFNLSHMRKAKKPPKNIIKSILK
jgi:hypothetical protein